MNAGERIEELAIPLLANDSQFVVSVTASSLQGPQKITVVLDGDNGVTIDDCARLSQRLLAILEEKAMVGENFVLEVTTPGLDRPLRVRRQFVKNIGRGVRVHLTDKKIVEGKLSEVSEDNITLEHEVREGKKSEWRKTSFTFPEIEKVYIQILFK